MAVTPGISTVTGMSNAKTAILTASGTIIIFSQMYHNTSVSAVTLVLWVDPLTTDAQWLDTTIDPGDTLIIDTKITLTNGMKIEAQAGTNAVLDNVISYITVS